MRPLTCGGVAQGGPLGGEQISPPPHPPAEVVLVGFGLTAATVINTDVFTG